jgi:diguanylate cyclase (GGDEF)-like protein
VKSFRQLSGIAVGLALLAAGAIGITILALRNDAIDGAVREQRNLAIVLGQQISYSTHLVESTLNQVEGYVARMHPRNSEEFRALMQTERVHRFLLETYAGLPKADAITITADDGSFLASTRGWPPPKVSIGDREHFIYFRDNADRGIHIGIPAVSRVSNETTIFITKRISATDGHFLGVVLVAMNLQYYHATYDGISALNGKSILLSRSDGTTLVRHPSETNESGNRLPRSSPWYSVVARNGGYYRSSEPADPDAKIVYVHPLADYPIVVSVADSQHEVLTVWRSRAFAIAIGSACTLACVAWLLWMAFGQLQRLLASEEALAKRTQKLTEAQNLGKLGEWSLSLDAQEFWLAPQVYDLLAYPITFVPTREAVLQLCDPNGANRFLAAQSAVLRAGGARSVDVKMKRGDGTIGDFEVTTKVMTNAGGGVVGFSGTVQDISERKIAEEKLERLAYFDPLTGLPNRSLFHREINDVLTRRGQAALLLLDLDRFKEVNDSLGHASGDELLDKVAQLISRALGEGPFFARLGGDEFAIIVPDVADPATVEQLAAKVIAAVSSPIALERGEVTIGTSIGIALIPRDGVNLSDLQRNADLALYRAKDGGRGRLTLFEPEMSTALQHKLLLARELRRAITDDVGLDVHYQPQVSLEDERVSGFEALMRWTHPTLGIILPSEFIPIAESSQLICELGLWILRRAAHQASAWLAAEETTYEIAVNVSAAQIWHSDFVSDVEEVLRETSLPPHLLCLELTESLLADHAEGRVRSVLVGLKRLGVTLALDDFGTDYSSLGYLTQLPFDKLKVDRIFVAGIAESDRARKLLEGIIALGHGLGMKIVAEGAEVEVEVALLKQFQCDMVQGYVFGRPAKAADALAFAHALAGKFTGGTDLERSVPTNSPPVRKVSAAA